MRPRTQHGRHGTIPHAPLGTTPVAHAPTYKTRRIPYNPPYTPQPLLLPRIPRHTQHNEHPNDTSNKPHITPISSATANTIRQTPCNPRTSRATRKGIQQPSTPQCEDSVAWRTVSRRMRRLVRVSRMPCENPVTQHRDCSRIQPPDPDSCLRCENPITRQEDYLPDSTTQTTQSLRARQSAHTLPTRTAPNRRFGVTEGGCVSIPSHDDCLGGTWRPMLVGAGGAMRESMRTTAIPTPIAQRLTTSASPQPPSSGHRLRRDTMTRPGHAEHEQRHDFAGNRHTKEHAHTGGESGDIRLRFAQSTSSRGL